MAYTDECKAILPIGGEIGPLPRRPVLVALVAVEIPWNSDVGEGLFNGRRAYDNQLSYICDS